ncbi:RNA polymerase sigma factor [Neobacillus sp. PS2-9]|uniref:RNA polymerase sigma factor n=1 Tax=Neobacillus sp. PS2-9 TaxID=3070676 RepID=UPI0027E13906|nr:RNA polymerase sigma factor [Neobacillus sp. PS2-9]WML58714.1 RNA polymerase sigma factor [Neobacillus sp. PS2-9]
MENELTHLLMQQARIVFKYLMKLGASKEDAEDIIQGSLEKAVIYIDSIEKDKLTAWLIRVSINQYYNNYKKNKRQRTLQLDEQLTSTLIQSDLLEDQLLAKESAREITKVLDLMSDSFRTLLIFKYMMELSYQEISMILDMPEKQVKTYLYRARLKFKQLWTLEKSDLEANFNER